jgi:hypothetical protein
VDINLAWLAITPHASLFSKLNVATSKQAVFAGASVQKQSPLKLQYTVLVLFCWTIFDLGKSRIMEAAEKITWDLANIWFGKKGRKAAQFFNADICLLFYLLLIVSLWLSMSNVDCTCL